MRRGHVFEPEVVKLARSLIVPGTIVLDVGSNFGQMALLFAQMVGDAGRVLAFEADEFVFSVLQRNIAANGARNIEPHLGAVHERSGERAFYPVPDFKRFGTYGSHGIEPRATSGRSIQTLRIDDLEIAGRVSFMKIDVQGCDLFAMRGAASTIARHRMPILFEYEQGLQSEFQTSFQQYVDFVSQIGYRFERTVYGINYLIVPRER
jgi:FkbM family methyltransferase